VATCGVLWAAAALLLFLPLLGIDVFGLRG